MNVQINMNFKKFDIMKLRKQIVLEIFSLTFCHCVKSCIRLSKQTRFTLAFCVILKTWNNIEFHSLRHPFANIVVANRRGFSLSFLHAQSFSLILAYSCLPIKRKLLGAKLKFCRSLRFVLILGRETFLAF